MVNKYQKHKEKLQKEAPERYQHFSEKKKKTKSINLLLSSIQIFLNKKKKRNVNMVVSDM